MISQLLPCCLVSAVINRTATAGKNITTVLHRYDIHAYTLMSGRTALFKERGGLIGTFMPGRDLAGLPAECFSFLVGAQHEAAAVSAVAEGFNLCVAGNGSVFSEEINQSGFSADVNIPVPGRTVMSMRTALMGICCIVQRGEGDALAQVVLDSGIGSPAMVFGEGTGLRDKLGLLRITIPAEKEVLTIVAGADEADAVMDLMISAGKLDLPGRGFIYLYPVKQGILDPRVSVGSQAHAATMDQVILAVDELTGNTHWRRHGLDAPGGSMPRRDRAFLTGLLDLDLHCDEGRGADLIGAAMAAGAAGATIAKIRQVYSTAQPTADSPSPAREHCSMIIAVAQADTIIDAVEKAGLYDRKTHGRMLVRQVPRACTYLGGKTKGK